MANASKMHEARELNEVIRMLIDICGGFVARPALGPRFRQPRSRPPAQKYLKGAADVPVENRIRMFRLVEKMALESADSVSDIHGGGSARGSPDHHLPGQRSGKQEKGRQKAGRHRGLNPRGGRPLPADPPRK